MKLKYYSYIYFMLVKMCLIVKTVHGFVLSYSEILFLKSRYARNCLLPIIEISKFIHE